MKAKPNTNATIRLTHENGQAPVRTMGTNPTIGTPATRFTPPAGIRNPHLGFSYNGDPKGLSKRGPEGYGYDRTQLEGRKWQNTVMRSLLKM